MRKTAPAPISVTTEPPPSATGAYYVREEFADGEVRYWLRRSKVNRPLIPDECREQMTKLVPHRLSDFFPEAHVKLDYHNLEIHPYCELVPVFSEFDFEALRESMERENRLDREPIVLYQGKILDGRHRYAVATALGLELDDRHFAMFEGTDEEAREHVFMLVTRRHMTTAQKAAFAARVYYPLEKEAARQREQNGTPCDSSRTGRASDLAGKRIGVSGRSVERALEIQKLSPAVFDAMFRGEYGDLSEARRATGAEKPKNARKSRPRPRNTRDVLAAITTLFLAQERGMIEMERTLYDELVYLRDELR